MKNYNDFNLIVEKRIGQIVSNLDVIYSLDVITTIHSFERSKNLRTELDGYNNKPISNNDINHLISKYKKEISEKIFYGFIKNQIDFVIKSKSDELSLAITPIKKSNNWWQLIIKTCFRESDKHSLYTGYNQIVIGDN